jgi:hypothetical protein
MRVCCHFPPPVMVVTFLLTGGLMAADGKLQALTARGQLVQGILVSLPSHKLGSVTSTDTRRLGTDARSSSGGGSSSSRHAQLMYVLLLVCLAACLQSLSV